MLNRSDYSYSVVNKAFFNSRFGYQNIRDWLREDSKARM